MSPWASTQLPWADSESQRAITFPCLSMRLTRESAKKFPPGEVVFTLAGPVSRIMLCGGSAMTPGVSEFLQRRFNVPCEIANPLARIAYEPALFSGQDVMKVAPLLTVGIGLALRRLGDKK